MSIIEDGTGDKWKVKVDSNNRLAVASNTEPFQHVLSKEEEQSYQMISTTTVTGSGRYVGLLLKNISTNRDAVITYIRQQLVTGSTMDSPSEANYFFVGKGRSYLTGGMVHTSVNMNIGSTREPDVTTYCKNPTLSGDLVEFDRYYPAGNALVTYNKQGAVIIQPQQTIEVGFVTNYTTGSFYTRVSYVMQKEK